MYSDAETRQRFSATLQKSKRLLAETRELARETRLSISKSRRCRFGIHWLVNEPSSKFYQTNCPYAEQNSADHKHAENHENNSAQEIAQQMLLHDIRGPIGRITSLLSLVQTYQLPAEAREFIQLAVTQSQEVNELTQVHYIYHQLTQGSYSPKEELFDALALCRNIQDSLREQHPGHPIEVRVHGRSCSAGNKFPFCSDAILLRLILQNLMQNAVEASPADQAVQVDLHLAPKAEKKKLRAQGQKSYAYFTIHNYGMIPKAIQARFFEKFTTYGKLKGTGLGTYITKLAVEALGGTITFTTSEVCGTSLRVRLPDSTIPKRSSIRDKTF